MNAEEALARELCGADGKVNWTSTIPLMYRDMARNVLASDWYAERIEEARRELVAEAVRRIEAMRPDVSLEAHPTGDESLVPDMIRRRALNDAAEAVCAALRDTP